MTNDMQILLLMLAFAGLFSLATGLPWHAAMHRVRKSHRAETEEHLRYERELLAAYAWWRQLAEWQAPVLESRTRQLEQLLREDVSS